MSPRNQPDDAEAGTLGLPAGCLPFDPPRQLDRPKPETAPRELPPSRRGAPETSAAAAASIGHATRGIRGRLYDALAARGAHGGTNEELQAELELSGDTIRPRMWELRGCDLKRPELGRGVIDSGLRRATGAKRRAVVWVCS